MGLKDINENDLKQIQEFHKNIIMKLDETTFNLGIEIARNIINQVNPNMIIIMQDGKKIKFEFDDITFIAKD